MADEIQTELATIREAATIAPLPDRAFLRIAGPDATRWLNGMVTNNIAALSPGEGSYNFLLNAQGRIQGDCTLYREPAAPEPAFLLATDNSQLETIHHHLDRFIIMDDVELTPLNMTGLSIIGPSAHQFCVWVSIPYPGFAEPEPLSDPPLGKMYRGLLGGGERITLYSPPAASGQTDIERVEIWSHDSDDIRRVERALTENGAKRVSAAALEALRIVEGRPRFGQDITGKYLPQETAQTQALHFAKGCYLGQEIVERIRSRGQVHRTLTQLRLTGTLPETLPAPLESNSKPAGEITSAALIGNDILALGYVRRDLLDTHQPLTYPGGTAIPHSLS